MRRRCTWHETMCTRAPVRKKPPSVLSDGRREAPWLHATNTEDRTPCRTGSGRERKACRASSRCRPARYLRARRQRGKHTNTHTNTHTHTSNRHTHIHTFTHSHKRTNAQTHNTDTRTDTHTHKHGHRVLTFTVIFWGIRGQWKHLGRDSRIPHPPPEGAAGHTHRHPPPTTCGAAGHTHLHTPPPTCGAVKIALVSFIFLKLYFGSFIFWKLDFVGICAGSRVESRSDIPARVESSPPPSPPPSLPPNHPPPRQRNFVQSADSLVNNEVAEKMRAHADAYSCGAAGLGKYP